MSSYAADAIERMNKRREERKAEEEARTEITHPPLPSTPLDKAIDQFTIDALESSPDLPSIQRAEAHAITQEERAKLLPVTQKPTKAPLPAISKNSTDPPNGGKDTSSGTLPVWAIILILIILAFLTTFFGRS